MRGMPGENAERLYFDGRHGGLATFTRKVMSKNDKGSFLEKKTSLRGNATPGHTAFKKGRFFEKQKLPAGATLAPQPRRGNARGRAIAVNNSKRVVFLRTPPPAGATLA